jgi:hypothetical protein
MLSLALSLSLTHTHTKWSTLHYLVKQRKQSSTHYQPPDAPPKIAKKIADAKISSAFNVRKINQSPTKNDFSFGIITPTGPQRFNTHKWQLIDSLSLTHVFKFLISFFFPLLW